MDVDTDLDEFDREELIAEVRRLRAGIRAHRDSSGHDLCWHHPQLWGLLPEQVEPEVAVPPWPPFMRGCVAYRESLDNELPHARVHDREFEPSGIPGLAPHRETHKPTDDWEAVLDHNRAALVQAVRPLTDEQSRRRLVPSATTPIALIKHCAAAERVWFQRTIGAVEESECDGYARGDDQSWVVPPGQTLEETIAEYETAAERSREIARTAAEGDVFVHYRRGAVGFSWICAHMIEELARHAGHADILVEQILAADHG